MRGYPGEPFSRFFPSRLSASGRSERKGVYDDSKDVRDAGKYIAPESGPGEIGRERDIDRSARRQRFVVLVRNESAKPIEHTRLSRGHGY